MPKTNPYPTCSIQKTLPIIELLAENNNTLAVKDAAGLLGQSQSGHFMNIISSAVKFSLLKHKKGVLTLSELGASLLDDQNQLKQDVLRQVLEQPKGFASLLKIWNKKEHIDLDIIGQYLELSSSESQNLQKVLEDSFSLLNPIQKMRQHAKRKSKKKVLNNTESHFFVHVKGENLHMEQCIQSKDQLKAFIHFLEANF